MKRACDLLIEQDVPHRLQNARIKPKRKFADVTRARIGIENLVQLFCFVACRIDNLSVFELETDGIETDALINTRRVERYMTLYGIFHRAAKNFAIGNIAIATTDHGWNSLDTETEVGPGAFDLDAVCLFHQPLKRFHAGLEFAIIQCADFEIKIFKRLRAHSGKLRH